MHTSLRRIATTGAAVVTTLVTAAAPSLAAPAPQVGQFFSGGAGSASYDRSVSAHGRDMSIRLDVPDNGSWAGFEIKHTTDALPEQAPSFAYLETGTPSGGAPRLVIESADGCIATEYALAASATTWTTAGQWDLTGSCDYVYNASWDAVRSAFADDTVESVYLVSDAYAGAHTDWVDDVSYGSPARKL